MPKKISDLTFLRNTIRYYLDIRHQSLSTMAQKIRLMDRIAVLNAGYPVTMSDQSFGGVKRLEDPPTIDDPVKAMLKRVAEKRGKVNAELS